MKISDITPHLLYQFKSEHDLLDAIEELSKKFTQDRSQIGDYLKDPRLVSAYTVFYLVTNIPKLQSVFQWMPERWLEEIKECDLVDVGAGPGTFSLAFKEWGGIHDVYQIETSDMMRAQAMRIWQGLHPESTLHQMTRWQNKTDRSKLLLFGHSANEMGADEALNYVRKVGPEHILFIEPGTKSFFPEMLKIREALIQEGFHILFPCPTSDDCPIKNNESDWCHQFVHVTHGADVERISQMVRKDRKLLPLTVHAYSKTVRKTGPTERLVRVHPSTKFSFEWDVCLGPYLEHYQILKRPYSKKEIKELEEILAGASVESEIEKELEKSKRVKLLKIK